MFDMYSWGLSGLALIAAVSCGTQPAESSKSGPQAAPRIAAVDTAEAMATPPPGATRLCNGHVSGVPQQDGTPGPHIAWEAYSTPALPTALVAHYQAVLGRAPDASGDACRTWRHPSDDSQLVLEVCTVAAQGPWSTCGPVPGSVSSIVVVSTMVEPG